MAKSFLECHTELSVEISVNKRVEGRVEVADPEDSGNNNVGAVTLVSTYSSYQVPTIREYFVISLL